MSDLVETMEDGTEIDIERATRMLKRVTDLEKKNIQTRRYTASAMVEKIRGFIEEEAKCF